ncbi:prolactin-7A1-like isoform X2 [Cricetulus griseus]|uniref:Prolactin-7A1-like isoform X2 n=1 Tax=Cricetulus griseus TaxID=10029 RepID=A0A9J7JKJ3_CRIGR|nr:prolactin-7A1-like isoform X2 [Cricetulus griseus]
MGTAVKQPSCARTPQRCHCLYLNRASWALLLLVVSNLLLWENVASVPLNSSDIIDDQLYLKELFDHAMEVSQNISTLNIEMRRIYTTSQSSAKYFEKFLTSSSMSSNQFMLEFLGNQKLQSKNLISCHNYSIKTPENMDKAQEISLEDFPKLILSRVQAWNNNVHNLLTILRSIPGIPGNVLSLAKDIKTKIAELSEDTKSLMSKVNGTRENGDYNIWSGLEDVKSSDENSRFIALCKLSYCLHVDIHTVDLSLFLLRCMVLVNSDICKSPRITDDL